MKSHLSSDDLNFTTSFKNANYVIIHFHLNCYKEIKSLGISNFDQDFLQARLIDFFFFFSINIIVQHSKLENHSHQAPKF